MEQAVKQYDVAIVGAGPAGAACALRLADAALRIVLLDKSSFPRDKICGDALSADVVNQLEKISPVVAAAFEKQRGKVPSYGVRIFAPNEQSVELPFRWQGESRHGFLLPRLQFDNILVEEVRKQNNVTFLENTKVENIRINADDVHIETQNARIVSRMVIGADGANSIVKKFTTAKPIDRKHHSAGLRMYYEGISGVHPDNYIDLYFFRHILPGYLWIFPLADGRSNVGIGMLSSTVSAKRLDIKKILNELISVNPMLRKRFASATALETPKGFGLPLGSAKRTLSGARWILLGDAAGLIDPFSGEGIGNAIRSGRIAADHIKACFASQDFSAAFNARFDDRVHAAMGKEFQMSRRLQKLCSYPFLFNLIVNKARRNTDLHTFLTDALVNVNEKKGFGSPLFYYNLLFR